MQRLSTTEVEAAWALGHRQPAMFETAGGRWFMTCSCGYKSATRTSELLALEAGVHHVRKAVKEAARNGRVSVRGSVGPRL